MNINSLAAFLEGVLEELGEEYAEERRREDTTLFDSATNCNASKTAYSLHDLEESEIDFAQSGHEKNLHIITDYILYGLKDMKLYFQDDAE